MKDTLTIKEVANALGMAEQGVRVQLQRGLLPFGYAIKSVSGNEYRYIIPRKKFEEYMGVHNDKT